MTLAATFCARPPRRNNLAKKTFLDFEQPIAELESKIEELRYVQSESAVDISDEIDQLSKKSQQLTKDIYGVLTPWQITKIARHPERPYTLDYVRDLFTNKQVIVWQRMNMLEDFNMTKDSQTDNKKARKGKANGQIPMTQENQNQSNNTKKQSSKNNDV